MSEILQWETGINGYKKHSLHNNHFTTELTECQFEKGRNIDDIFLDSQIKSLLTNKYYLLNQTQECRESINFKFPKEI